MTRLIWRGFLSRKLRSTLTGVAIALGVALMAGTYILTDTINASFESIFSSANQGHDVVVTPHRALGRGTRLQLSPITDATLARVRRVSGVARAAGSIFSTAALLTVSGRRLTGHAPAFVIATVPRGFESFSPLRGRLPRAASEVALDQSTASREGLRVGDALVVAGAAPARRYAIVGIVKFAGSRSFGGAAAALLPLAEAQRVTGESGRYDQLDVAARPGVTPSDLSARIRAALPATVDVRTGAQQAAQQTSDLKSNLGFLRTFLLIFAYVALFVGAFIIFNTFSITVAQRTREFGLLRTLGATRVQVMRSVVAEGLLLGLGGAVLGLLGGIALAPGLDELFKAFGADLPDSGTVLETRTVVVSLVLGTLVTVAAGLLPAMRATRVAPIAAMREGVPLRARRSLLRGRAGVALVAVLIVARIVVALTSGGGGSAATIVIVVVVVVVGVVRLRRIGRPRRHRVVRGLAQLLGGLVAWRGITGRLARENVIRQPGRTLVTAAALTIGLALVTFVSILAAGTKASIDTAVDRSFAGDLIVDNSSGAGDQGIPARVAPALGRIPGVAGVTPIAFSKAKVNRLAGTASVTAVDPPSFTRVYRVDWHTGSNATIAALGTTGAVLTRRYADANHLRVGQRLSALTPSDRRVTLVVRGIATDNARLLGQVTIALPLARAMFGQRDDAIDFVSYARGVDGRRVQAAVDRLLRAEFPQAQSRTAAQFKHDQAAQVDTLLTLIYVLLALSVIVSLFGIVNTLILSIYERQRELGMLRAIGTTRRQLRAMIRYESFITSLIGGVLGLAFGILLGVVSSAALKGQGFVLAIPVVTLAVLLVVAGAAGVLAAIAPARRATRLDPLRALAAE